MGYYTNYTLEILEGNDYQTDYEEEIAKLTDYNHLFIDDIKWYEHDTDMIKYSKSKPNVLFKLNGKGEEVGDMWFKYYKNGKMQFCPAIISFDEYDETKLKEYGS